MHMGVIPLAVIHVSGPFINIFQQLVTALLLAKFTCQNSFQTIHYPPIGKNNKLHHTELTANIVA